MHTPDSSTRSQLRLIGKVAEAFRAARIGWWLFDGWAIDFHAGEVTRDHADIEIFAWQRDVARARDALIGRGYLAPPGLYPDECQSFIKDGQEIGLWFLNLGEDGRARTPGRWRDCPSAPDHSTVHPARCSALRRLS